MLTSTSIRNSAGGSPVRARCIAETGTLTCLNRVWPLKQTEIAVSSGAACSTADREPSHVLRAMGLSSDLARASIRVGLGRPTTAAEIERAAESLIRVIGKLRGGSG